MGLNFYVCCHTCKKKVFLYRGEESIPMHTFYRKHSSCGNKPYKNYRYIEIKGDYDEQDWMSEPNENGYEYDEIQNELNAKP